jgi:2-succinyl-5-enolpyruvyl-6-hydroxy-3-cyclohexene-1-carboxylate synthase
VVTDDNGGGLFTQLEPGAPEYAASFERVFATPTGTDVAAWAAAAGVAVTRCADLADLRAALAAPGPSAPTSGAHGPSVPTLGPAQAGRATPPAQLRVLVVPVDRTRVRDLHADVRRAVAGALR